MWICQEGGREGGREGIICYAMHMHMHMQCICFEKCEFCFAGIVCSEITPKKKREGKEEEKGVGYRSFFTVYLFLDLSDLRSELCLLSIVIGR